MHEVENWLSGERNALVCIVRPCVGGTVGRVMGFVYAILPSGYTVICTCRHAFLSSERLADYRFYTCTWEGESYQPMHNQPMYAVDGHDVAFIVCHPRRTTPQPLDVAHYDRYVPEQEEIFLNAKNDFGGFGLLRADVMGQPVTPHEVPAMRAWCLSSNESKPYFFPATAPEVPALREQGYKELGLVHMVSRPGCSGSPIWDLRLRLVGMDVCGTFGGGGDYVGYVYAGDIRRAYQSLESTF